MELVADGLLLLTALTTGIYCLVLSRRLRRLGSSEGGIGKRIEALGTAIEETRAALSETRGRLDDLRREAQSSGERMARDTTRAKRIADELASAAVAAERTLDSIYRAEKTVSRGDSSIEPLAATFEPALEIVTAVETTPGDATATPGPVDLAYGPETAQAHRLTVGVLKAERMTL